VVGDHLAGLTYPNPGVVRRLMHPFRLAVQERDIASIEGMLAAEVKLYSPIPFRPFEGTETVMAVLHGLSAVHLDHRHAAAPVGCAGSDRRDGNASCRQQAIGNVERAAYAPAQNGSSAC
jgi:hypothetical protein